MQFKKLFRLLTSKKSKAGDCDCLGDSTAEKIKVLNDMDIHIRGLPQTLPHETKAILMRSLLRNALVNATERIYQKGESIYIGKASLRIEDRNYNIEFSVVASQVLTALSIYKKAFDEVNSGANLGVYDTELAENTADFIRESARQEFERLMKPRESATKKPHLVIDATNEGKSIGMADTIKKGGLTQ